MLRLCSEWQVIRTRLPGSRPTVSPSGKSAIHVTALAAKYSQVIGKLSTSPDLLTQRFFMPAITPHRTHVAARIRTATRLITLTWITRTVGHRRSNSPTMTKTALHRTRLWVLHHKNFSVLFLCKPMRQCTRLLAF